MKRILLVTFAFLVVLGVVTFFYLQACSFDLSDSVERNFVVDLPPKVVAINLLQSNAADEISRRLGITTLSSETVRSGNVDMGQFLSGKWEFEQEELSLCELEDENLGKLTLKVRSITKAVPGKIEIVTELAEPSDPMLDFRQVITIRPTELSAEPKPGEENERPRLRKLFPGALEIPQKTQFHIEYSTTIRVNYPDVAPVRKIAAERMDQSLNRTIDVIADTLKELASKPMAAILGLDISISQPMPMDATEEVPESPENTEEDVDWESWEDPFGE